MQKTNSSEKRCLICGQPLLRDGTGFALFKKADYPICGQCQMLFIPSIKKSVLYIYDDFFRSLLFRYKALGDLALAPVFLLSCQEQLARKYRHYVIVPAPSSPQDNLARGFAALPWIFKSLHLPFLPILYKNQEYKQAVSKHREDIYKVIRIHNGFQAAGKKILLVDDVMTSGHTLRACQKLLADYHPQCIDTLVLASRQVKRDSFLERIIGEKYER